ncbi:MAG: class I SAM-dependent rRNA methyltransferase [Patescibacteria group bacterium]
MIKLTVHSNRIGPIRGRHPWVFSGALKQIPEGIAGGEPVELTDEAGSYLASGYFNSYSQIAVRVWDWERAEVNQEFFSARIRDAFELRKKFVLNKKTNACRIVNGENDLLPGLIVDLYGDYAVVQFHNPGIERWKKEIVEALVTEIKLKGIFERSDVRDRKRAQIVIPAQERESTTVDTRQPIVDSRSWSGMTNEVGMTGLLFGKIPNEIKILENGYKFQVNIKEGQKTGFFLDQRDKRQALEKYSKGKSVLNCFSYTGGFSVYALGAGAKKVVSVDSSKPALEEAERNVILNKLDEKKAEFILADVKEYLADRAKDEFDVIILDPPAFVKDRRKVHEGLQGYRKINEAALRILPKNGILVTCSCSAHVSLQDFRFMLSEAAARAGRTVQIIETFTHGIDHPNLVAFTEGEYLKCIFAIVR